MTLRSLLRDDRVILAGIGLGSILMVQMMLALLTKIRDDKEIKVLAQTTQYITQDTEDSLQLETLEKLLAHPNDSVRQVSVKILCDRAANHSDSMIYLLWGISQNDYEERKKCLRALLFLMDQDKDGNSQTISILHMPEAYAALIQSLELSLARSGDEKPRMDKSYNDFPLRDAAERFSLMLAMELVTKFGPHMLIQAGFVKKWLAKQNWGHDELERQRTFSDYYMHGKRNHLLLDLIKRIAISRRGLRALQRAGLIEAQPVPEPNKEKAEEIMLEPQTREEGPRLWFVGQGRRPGEPIDAGGVGSRTRDHTAEGQRLRRQHREAMVLNDGTRPVGRQDIIERGSD